MVDPLLRVPQPTAAELAAEGVSVRFQGLAALSEVNLTLLRGEIVGLIGPNGAGKTTLINCLTGFQRPTTGRVALAREDTAGWNPARFRKAGVARTFQAGRLFRDMTVAENVEVTGVGLGLDRKSAHSVAMEVLDWLGIADKAARTAGTLDYTDERRVGIARALVLPPAFILMDEPAAGMSDSEGEDLVGLVTSIPTKFGCGVLIIEHNMRVIMNVSHRLYVLDGGRTVAQGTPAEVQANPAVISAYLGADV